MSEGGKGGRGVKRKISTLITLSLLSLSLFYRKIRSMKNMLAGGAPVPPSQVGKMRAKAKRIKSGQVPNF